MNISEEGIKEGPLETLRAEQRAAIGCSFLSSWYFPLVRELYSG
jgi:hypothetical protein